MNTIITSMIFLLSTFPCTETDEKAEDKITIYQDWVILYQEQYRKGI